MKAFLTVISCLLASLWFSHELHAQLPTPNIPEEGLLRGEATSEGAQQLNALYSLASKYQLLLPDSSLFYATLGLKVSRQAQNKTEEVRFLTLLGLSNHYLGNTQVARNLLNQAREISETRDIKEAKIYSNNALAQLNLLQNRTLSVTFNYIGDALQLAKDINYKPGIVQSLTLYGDYFMSQDPGEALKKYLEALAVLNEVDLPYVQAQLHLKAGMAYQKHEKDFRGAWDEFRKSLNLSEDLYHLPLIVKNLNEIGRIHHNLREDPYEAFKYHRDAFAIALKKEFYQQAQLLTESIQEIKLSLSDLAKVELRNGNQAKADEYDKLYKLYDRKLSLLMQYNFDINRFLESERKTYSREEPSPSINDPFAQILKERNTILSDPNINLGDEVRNSSRIIEEMDSIGVSIFDKDTMLSQQFGLNSGINNQAGTDLLDQSNATSPSKNPARSWLTALLLATMAMMVCGFVLYLYQHNRNQSLRQIEQFKALSERMNRQEVVLREKDDQLTRKEEELAQSYANLDDALLENTSLTHLLREDLSPPLRSILTELNSSKPNEDLIKQLSRLTLLSLENILSVQSPEDTHLNVQLVDAPVFKLAQNAIQQFTELFQLKNIHVINNIPPYYFANVDAEHIERVFMCLLDNSFKYLPDGEQIVLEAHTQADKVVVSLQDTGPVIPQQSQSLAFQKFGPEDARPSGLGLAFAKLAIEAHQGDIHIDSQYIKGTRFVFSLPESLGKSFENIRPTIDFKRFQTSLNQMSPDDLKKLKLLGQSLAQYQLFETSALIDSLNSFDWTNFPEIHDWKKSLEFAVFHLDSDQFSKLIALVQ